MDTASPISVGGVSIGLAQFDGLFGKGVNVSDGHSFTEAFPSAWYLVLEQGLLIVPIQTE
jgi:hypothetical protein